MGRELIRLPFGASVLLQPCVSVKKDTVVVVYALTTRSGNSRLILFDPLTHRITGLFLQESLQQSLLLAIGRVAAPNAPSVRQLCRFHFLPLTLGIGEAGSFAKTALLSCVNDISAVAKVALSATVRGV